MNELEKKKTIIICRIHAYRFGVDIYNVNRNNNYYYSRAIKSESYRRLQLTDSVS